MAWGEQAQLTERFAAVRSFLKQSCGHWRLGSSYDGWVQALLREKARLVPLIFARLRQATLNLREHQHCGRWLALAVDGTHLTCPRTRENQPAMGDVGKPDGMPLLSLTTIYHLRLGLPWDFRVGPGIESERAQLRAMLDDLPTQSLLVADAGFAGYDLCRDLLERGRHFLFRVGGNMHLLSDLGCRYEVHGQTIYLWPADQQQEGQPPLQLRLIVVQDENRQPVYLITSVLDPADLTDAEAGEIYRQRWGIEVFYRTAKQTLQGHTLRSRTPENCYQEATWLVFGVWLLGLLTARALRAAKLDPATWSPARARNVVHRVLRHQPRCSRSRRMLMQELARCVKDVYVRRGSKASRNYPRKKQHKPPGPPKIKSATPPQQQLAQRLTPITIRA